MGGLLIKVSLGSIAHSYCSLPSVWELAVWKGSHYLAEKSDSLCLSHSGKFYGLYPTPASLLGAWSFSICQANVSTWLNKDADVTASLPSIFKTSSDTRCHSSLLGCTLCDAVGLLALSSPLLLSLSPSHWNLGWCPVPSLLTHHQHPSSLRTQHRPEPNTACRLSILGKHKYMVKHKYKCITMLFNKLKNSSRTALTFQLWMQGC